MENAELVSIKIKRSTLERLKKDRDLFTKQIGLRFSIDDTINEYFREQRLWEKNIKIVRK